MNLRCIIVDDEPNAVSLLEVLLQETTTWQLMAKCYNALEALTFLKTNPVDLIFLDINMPQLSGLELATLLPKETKIVFTTAYSRFGAESYSYNTIEYLLKPITLNRFLVAVQKIESFFTLPATDEKVETSRQSGDYFFVKSGKMIHTVLLDEILYFEGMKEYVRMVTTKDQILIYRRVKEIEQQLKLPFVRVHNSYIINTKKLTKIQDNHIYMGDKQIPISEKFRNALMTVIHKNLF